MATPVAIPVLGDSVSEAVLTKWLKNDGDYVKDAEPIAELETDKANVDLPAPAAGVLKRSVDVGATVKIKQVVASIDEKATAPVAVAAPSPVAPSAAKPADNVKAAELSPAPRRVVAEAGLDAAAIEGTGPGGRITKEDAMRAAAAKPVRTPPAAEAPAPAAVVPPPPTAPKPAKVEVVPAPVVLGNPASLGANTGDNLPFAADGTKRVPMSKIRKKIAERLVSAQHTAAILHTYNEIDLTEVMALRAKHKDTFEKLNGVGLGFMSFFVKAVCAALKAYPKVNAQIDGDDVVYFDHVHMGIAVSTERGLVVPVLRNAHAMSFAQIESEIKRLAIAARDGKLAMNEMSGGTFSITNGGVFGSLLSAPILNPPQSGILGMHAIQKRPVVVNDEIKIRNMMYVVLGYDHRMVDGKDSVSFLVKVKQLLEDPSRLLLDV
jgi:2-oxoglutarate dehydrogenase E2 component (dihydrolipoamide succinyltransferase)